MQFPATISDLQTTLNAMKTQGFSKDDLQTVYDEFKVRYSAAEPKKGLGAGATISNPKDYFAHKADKPVIGGTLGGALKGAVEKVDQGIEHIREGFMPNDANTFQANQDEFLAKFPEEKRSDPMAIKQAREYAEGKLNQAPGEQIAESTTDVVKGGQEILSGAIGATAAPITATIEALPGGKPVLNFLGDIQGGAAKGLADVFGAGLGEEQKAALEESFNNLITLGVVKAAPTVLKAAKPYAKAAIEPIISKLPEALKTAGAKVAGAVLPVSETEATLAQNYAASKLGSEQAVAEGIKPRTTGETAVDRGIYGTRKGVGAKAKAEGTKMFEEEIQPALKDSASKMTREELFKPVEEKIAKTSDPIKKADLEHTYELLKEAYADKKWDAFDLEEAQKLKSEIDEFTPQKAFKGKEIANEYNQLTNDMADAIRQKTYNELGGEMKTKYLDYSNLEGLKKFGIKARQEGVLADLAGKSLKNLWSVVATPIGTSAGMFLYRIGNFFEFASPKRVNTLGEYLADQGITKAEFNKAILFTPTNQKK